MKDKGIRKDNVEVTPESIKEDKEKDFQETSKVVIEKYDRIFLVEAATEGRPLGGTRELHCSNCFAGTDMSTITLGEKDLVLKNLSNINNIVAHGSK